MGSNEVKVNNSTPFEHYSFWVTLLICHRHSILCKTMKGLSFINIYKIWIIQINILLTPFTFETSSEAILWLKEQHMWQHNNNKKCRQQVRMDDYFNIKFVTHRRYTFIIQRSLVCICIKCKLHPPNYGEALLLIIHSCFWDKPLHQLYVI